MNIFIMQNSIVRPLGRDMQNVLIGFVGEHEARTFFVRTRDDLTGYTISLVIGDVDCGTMTKAPMPDGSTMLSLTLTSDMLGNGGDKVCQLLMVKDTIVRKSSQFRAYVGASNDINSTAPDSATIIIISEKITELVHEAALDAIAEVQEVIDSIPADYSTLSAQVDTNTEDIGGLKADLGAHLFIGNAPLLTEGTDYNAKLSIGTYRVGSNALAKTMLNCPVELAHTLIVMITTASTRFAQIVITVSGTIYIRSVTSSTQTAWKKLAVESDEPEPEVDNILDGLTVHTGYYYSTDGEQVEDANFSTIENVPYNPSYSYLATHRPATYFMNASGEKIKYVSGSRSVTDYTLPTVYGATQMHISFNHKYFPNFVMTKERKNIEDRYTGKTCAIYGDSIAKGNYANIDGVVQKVPSPYLEMAATLAGMSIVANHAIGGSAYCTASDASSTLWHNQTGDGNPTANEADVIFISAGTNDWGHDSPLGSLGDTQTTTFYGAVYKTLDALKSQNPNSLIMVMTPLYRGSGDAYAVYNNLNDANCKMADYVNAIKEVCAILNVKCIDMSGAGVHPYYTPNNFYTDHLHPIQTGHTRMGTWVYSNLLNCFPVG